MHFKQIAQGLSLNYTNILTYLCERNCTYKAGDNVLSVIHTYIAFYDEFFCAINFKLITES